MDFTKLKKLEKKFLKQYPGGFSHPEMVEIGKKHKMDKMLKLAKENFSKQSFEDSSKILESLSKIVTSSSMVSLFEKPKFRDYIKAQKGKSRENLTQAIYQILHGKQADGFNDYLEILANNKMAKWTLISVLPSYYKPKKEIFVKPTITKKVIQYFDLDLEYKPRPSWEFYRKYRLVINKMKKEVDPSLSPSSAAFTGFLMMSLD